MQLGFAKAHLRIPLDEKVGDPGLGELPEIRGFPFNISATAEASDFKFGTQLGFAKANRKITPRGKVGVPSVREAPLYLGFPFNISAMAALSS